MKQREAPDASSRLISFSGVGRDAEEVGRFCKVAGVFIIVVGSLHLQ